MKEQETHDVWGDYAKFLSRRGGYIPPRKGTSNDAAHPPIHPVKCKPMSAFSNDKEWQLYELITKHFLAVCSDDARGQASRIDVALGDEEFHVSGLIINQNNFLEIWGTFEPWCAKTLPRFDGELTLDSLTLESGQTSAPDLISEVELITRMDKVSRYLDDDQSIFSSESEQTPRCMSI